MAEEKRRGGGMETGEGSEQGVKEDAGGKGGEVS